MCDFCHAAILPVTCLLAGFVGTVMAHACLGVLVSAVAQANVKRSDR